MDDEVERMAQAIHEARPVTVDGKPIDWSNVLRSHPQRAEIYREAARNRIRAEEAMKRLADEPIRRRAIPPT